MELDQLTRTIQRNSDISDARDSGVYSLCSLILKLRNHYKWEQGFDPWLEPEPPVVLDWIEAKENLWQKIAGQDFQPLPIDGSPVEPFDLEAVNPWLRKRQVYYGAGYGRSLKAIFFLAEIRRRLTAGGCPVLILGRELARELSAPFAMLQDGVIIIRREPLRFFFWDQVQEIRAAGRTALRQALRLSGVKVAEQVDRDSFRERLDEIVDREIPLFIHHELGEHRENALTGSHLRQLVAAFPDSAIELTARGVKDVLADTGPEGTLDYIIGARRESSLAFYAGFLDGLRQVLLPEIGPAVSAFLNNRDWAGVEKARELARAANLVRAGILRQAAEALEHEEPQRVKVRLEKELLLPLNL
jgi:hypothetical protein